MPIIPEIQDRLRLAFPESSDVALSRAVQEGSFLADHIYEGESFLDNLVGRDLRGHLRRVGIAHQINRYCERGDLPFVASMGAMPKGSWHWLEIISTGAVAHVCRTEDVFSFPEEAESRQDKRLSLQFDLLSFSERDRRPEIREVIREIPKLYAWMTFRAGPDGNISHLCWAVPAPDQDIWIAHINVLEAVAKRGEEVPVVTITADPKDTLRLKDHIVQALEEHSKMKGA